MPKLAIVTYTRSHEFLTPELIEIASQLRRHYHDVAIELYCESPVDVPFCAEDIKIRFHCLQGTKYRKLLHALQETDADYLLSLDNDIAANIPGLIRLAEDTIAGQFDLGWGRINSRKVSTFASKLVEVDKLLSHNLLRPTLWRFHVGVTIPGQCFLLKTATFKERLPGTDTYLDDLSIGLYAAKNRLRYHYSKEVVAFELPSYSFATLWKQRARWATGFKQTLSCPTLTRHDRSLLWVHAFSYHILPIVHLALLAAFSVRQPLLFLFLLSSAAIVMTKNRLESLGAALAYQLVFPLFHLGWIINFLRAKT
jgi:cellulose synthase/poly-beta-1,6-N-acetylglucosamine synthase-like glycosyltransferase